MNTAEKKLRREILDLLQKNARIEVREIAERLEVPEETVQRLISEMESDRTILGYYTLVSEDAPEDGKVRAVIEVSVQPERDGGFDHVARRVSKFLEVRTVYLMSGGYDLALEVEGNSLREVAFFVASKLAPLEGVKSTATHFLLKKYKEAGFVFEEEEDHERLKISP